MCQLRLAGRSSLNTGVADDWQIGFRCEDVKVPGRRVFWPRPGDKTLTDREDRHRTKGQEKDETQKEEGRQLPRS